MAKDSAAQIELGRSFHQEGTFNVKVSESDLKNLKHWVSTSAYVTHDLSNVTM